MYCFYYSFLSFFFINWLISSSILGINPLVWNDHVVFYNHMYFEAGGRRGKLKKLKIQEKKQKVTLLNRSFSDSSRNAAMKGVSRCEFQCMDSIINLSSTFLK